MGVISNKTGVQCTDCNATARPKDKGRFLRRHANCDEKQRERQAFARQLASTTRCVDDEEQIQRQEENQHDTR